MNQESKPTALVIAEELKEWAKDYAPSELALSLATAAYCLIESQHARIAALEDQLSATGAGGVESLRKREQDVGSSITIDFKQATELLEMFGGEPAEITLMVGDGHSGNGLYAIYTDMPEEGSGFLGTSDNETMPDAPAQEHATQLAGQGQDALQEVFKRADQLVDVIDDHDQNAPEHRSYVSGAYEDSLNDLRRAVTAARAAPAQAHKDEQA